MIADRFGIVGTVVASAYQVESVVAEGGFGVVYRARHGGFRAPVALKCLKVPQHLAPASCTCNTFTHHGSLKTTGEVK